MREQIYNLFIFLEDSKIKELGVFAHDANGTDKDKISLLKSSVDYDLPRAQRFPLDSSLTYSRYQAMERLGHHLELFEGVFQAVDAPRDPLVCVTCIVDGLPRIDEVTGIGAMQGEHLYSLVSVDYLEKYSTEEGFDMPRLLNDDYLLAIKLLYNKGYYVSCCKLIVSFIDTIAYLDIGDVPGNFERWLDEYADLKAIGIASSELWEFRNSLIHMTGLESRKVRKGRVRPISFYVGDLDKKPPVGDEKCFNLMELINEIASALERWTKTINSDRSKLETFVERYDLVVSDVRYASFPSE